VAAPPPQARPAQAPASLNFSSTPDVLLSPRALRDRQKGWLVPGLVVLGVVLVGTALTVWGYPYFKKLMEPPAPPPKAEDRKKEEEKPAPAAPPATHYVFKAPADPWEEDDRAAGRFKVYIAARRSEPSNHLAVYWRDYKTRLPSDAELKEIALARLQGYFSRPDVPLEWEVKKDGKLAGQRALVLEFVGIDPDNVPIGGECYMTAANGYGYWFFTWAPQSQRQQAEKDWPALRVGLTLGKKREGWQETPRETIAMPFPELPYELHPIKAIWDREPKPEAYAAKAKLVIRGEAPLPPADPDDRGNPDLKRAHAGKLAHLLVVTLPKAEEPKAAVEAAKAWLLQWEKDGRINPALGGEPEKPAPDPERPANEEPKLLPADPKKPIDGPEKIGEVNGHLAKLQVYENENQQRYAVLVVIPEAERVVVMVCECDWQRHDFWDHEFTVLLSGLRAVKKAP
jgi:hypothetical protein